jgi:hypothetical protein
VRHFAVQVAQLVLLVTNAVRNQTRNRQKTV